MLSPVPAADRFGSRTNPWAIGTAALVNVGIVALLLSIGLRSFTVHAPAPPHASPLTIDDLSSLIPHLAGGQGGGTHDAADASRGHLPLIEKAPLAPPQIPVLDHPKLAVDSAMTAPPNLKLPDDPSLINIGLPHSSNITVVSGGPGTRSGIGSGEDGGAGPGHGTQGFGPGNGDSVYLPGGNVSAPIPLFTPEAEFTDEARRQKFQGMCLISVIIDAQGNPQSPRVIRPLGMGLDENALNAVRRYRFKPARRLGIPVASRTTVAVNFRLF
ncbi:MAG TPA: energy transducer TonB [Terracidiphilus sp.]|nr:energy transducer TonB [Terracidiphilus sp.]